jgi:hypothetical protein
MSHIGDDEVVRLAVLTLEVDQSGRSTTSSRHRSYLEMHRQRRAVARKRKSIRPDPLIDVRALGRLLLERQRARTKSTTIDFCL